MSRGQEGSEPEGSCQILPGTAAYRDMQKSRRKTERGDRQIRQLSFQVKRLQMTVSNLEPTPVSSHCGPQAERPDLSPPRSHTSLLSVPPTQQVCSPHRALELASPRPAVLFTQLPPRISSNTPAQPRPLLMAVSQKNPTRKEDTPLAF